MARFCEGEPLWDTGLTWSNNTWPQFTECFQNVVIKVIPCVWLWLTSPLYIYILLSQDVKPRPIKLLFVMKTLWTAVLFLVFLMDLLQTLQESQDTTDYLVPPLSWLVTLVLHCTLLVLEKSRSIIRSPSLFIFWALAGVCYVVPLYSAVILKEYNLDPTYFAVLVIKYVSINVLFFLNCFAEYYGDREYLPNQNPEVTSSMISWLSFTWVNKLVVKGFKSPLVDSDVFDLNPRDQSSKEVKKVLRQWKRVEAKNYRNSVVKRRKRNTDRDETTPLLASKDYSDSLEIRDDGYDDRSSRKHNQKISIFSLFARSYWKETLRCQSGFVIKAISGIVSPLILGLLINFTANLGEVTWHGYIYIAALVLSKLASAVFEFISLFLTSCVALRVRSAAIATVFRKSLTVSSEARKESTVGEIVNLMSVDAANLEQAINYLFWIWLSFVFITAGVYLLYTVVGLIVFAGLGYMGVMFILNLWTMEKMRGYQQDVMLIKDERVKIMSEVLNGIKVIKLYGWEPLFIKKITDIREKELKILYKYAVLEAIQTFAWTVSVFWMLYIILVIFVMTDDSHYLDAYTSVLTINFIDLIKLGINILPIQVKDMVKAITSMKRMGKYLNSNDLNPNNMIRDTSDVLAIRISKADFKWEIDGIPTLQNINMEVSPGGLVAVVGTVGSGKSSLLSALLGELHRTRGYSNINSTVAYVPQSAWIQNNTVKENILFGKSLDRSFYTDVVKSCALQPDLDIMVAGDLTEIGEKGINLSGGQKQRVSLARAVYSNADIYFFDDPLSAVDSHVGRHIFDQVISNTGILKRKTRILVTHGVQWLPEVDYIYVMNQGRISEAGTYDQLISHNGAFAQFLTQYLTTDLDDGDGLSGTDNEDEKDKLVKADMLKRLVSMTSDDDTANDVTRSVLKLLTGGEDSSADEVSCASKHQNVYDIAHAQRGHRQSVPAESDLELSTREKSMRQEDCSRLTTDEEASGGKVSWSVYCELVKGFGGFKFFLFMCMISGYHVMSNIGNVWITNNWTDDPHLANFIALPANSTERRDRNLYYLDIFTLIGVSQTLFVILYAIVLQMGHIHASRKLHAELLSCVMHAPMSFFDTTPMGRVLNRFSLDIERLDSDIFLELEIFLDLFLQVIGIFVVISYTLPIFLAFVLPIVLLYYLLQQVYLRTSCQLRRLESNNRSPVYAHFSETLSGVSVIRAYQAQNRFITDSEEKIDRFQKCVSAFSAVNKWLLVRLEIVSFVVLITACVFAVVSRDSMSPGLVGLTITYALRVSIKFRMAVTLWGDFETHVVSVERIREYSVLKSEAPWTSTTDNQLAEDNWPPRGRIEFIDYSTRYRDGLDLVLNSLTCSISAGEKVGIVGRTGAGKSSMVLSLFRLIEASSGKIIIDGVDIAEIGLHSLRRHITILPQDPVLFAGTLRMNLDPFKEKSDSELWTALEHSHLRQFVESLPQKLDHEVGEGGDNLSMGQRQLVCLARTLLRQTRILVLDEATAAVDMETDELIQKTIREKFSTCTIITIAHRLNTVIDYDRILVLEKGCLQEFDSPQNLLNNHTSIFHSMAKQAGII